jgi:hypothetical protein
MIKMLKWILATIIIACTLTACENDATVVSRNLSQQADNFQVSRRIVFYNGITNDYMLTIEGRCSLGSGTETKSVTVTCQTGPNEYKKHFLGLSDNVTFFAEQVQDVKTQPYHYVITFKPSTIIPYVDMR